MLKCENRKQWTIYTNNLPADCSGNIVCLLFYVLATSKVISEWASTCDSAHSWWLNSASPLGDQAASTMTQYPTLSHYPDTESQSLPYPNNAKRQANKWQVSISLVLLNWGSNPWNPHPLISQNGSGRSTHSAIRLIQWQELGRTAELIHWILSKTKVPSTRLLEKYIVF